MKILKQAIAVFDCINKFLAVFVAILIIFVMLGVCADVLARIFANYSIRWMLEVTEYCMAYITFLGAAWLLQEEKHINMDLVLNRLDPRTRSMLNIITSFLGAIACLALARYSAQSTWNHFILGVFFSGEINAPKFIMLMLIPMASVMLFVQFLKRALGYLESWRASRPKQW